MVRPRTISILVLACGWGCSSDPVPVPVEDSGTPVDLGVDRPIVDTGAPVDTGSPVDARDAPAPTDAQGGAALAAARALITGTAPVTLSAALSDLIVTYRVAGTPGTDGGVSANDPAGFFVQAAMTGPAIFVAVDPATLTPAPQPGDRVSFTATRGEVHAGARWITALSGFARAATGVDRDALRQDLSAAADLVTGVTGYEHELARVAGTVAGNFGSAGTGFESAQITTAGVAAAMTNLRVRVPSSLRTSLGLRSGCTFTVTAPLWRFNDQVQVNAWVASDLALGTCPPAMDGGVTDGGLTDVGSDRPVDTGTDAGPMDIPLAPVDGAALDAGTEAAPTELWVLRVGVGTDALTNAATPVFLDRVRIADGTMAGASIALPTAAAGANRPFAISGTATSDGQLSRSLDRRYVLIAGYASAPGLASLTGTTAAAVPRAVARVAADGAIDTSTTLGGAFSGNNIRAAASADGLAFWAAGSSSASGAVVYAALGATDSTAVITTPTNGRYVALYDGTVYGAVGAGGQYGVFRVSGTTAALLPGFPTASGPSPYSFVAFDRDATAGVDVIYQCDDRAIASGGGVQKWTLGAGTWTLAGTFGMGLTAGCRGVTGFVDGANVTLLASTAESPSRLVRFVDSGGAAATVPATPLRTAVANTVFRGVALAPR